MADNIQLNLPTTEGATIATDDVAGIQHQLVKIEFGVDGVATPVTAAAPLPVTDSAAEASLASIDGKITAVNTGAVVVSSSALPSGASTAALQTTGNTSLGTIAGAVSGTEMQVDVLTMPTVAVTGTFFQATQPVSATNLDIRDLAAATDSVTVHGDVGVIDQLDLTNSNPAVVAIVDGNGDQITSFGGGTQYTEDAAAAANPIGTAVNLIRQDTPAGLTTTDGDNVAQRGTNYGAGYVQVVTSAGAFVDTFGGGTQYADGAADATPTGTVAMGTDGANVFAVHTDTAGDLQVDVLTLPNVTIGAAIPAGTNNIGDVDVLTLPAVTIAAAQTLATVTTVGAVTAITNALPAGTNNIGDVDILSIAAGTNLIGKVSIDQVTANANEVVTKTGSTTVVSSLTAALPAGTNNIGDVDIITMPNVVIGSGTVTAVTAITNPVAVTQSGTWDEVGINDSGNSITVDAPIGTPVFTTLTNATLQVGVIDETGVSAVDALAVGGGTAHDAVDSGNPVKVGGVAVSGSATPTSVAAGDRTRFIANQHGIPYQLGGHPNLITREYDFGASAQTDVNLAAALVAADERIYITRLEVLCDNANTVAVSARVGFGTANVPAASATGVSGMIASHPGIAAGSGIICGNGSGIIAVGAAGEEPRITTTAATSGNTHVIISYFLIDETP